MKCMMPAPSILCTTLPFTNKRLKTFFVLLFGDVLNCTTRDYEHWDRLVPENPGCVGWGLSEDRKSARFRCLFRHLPFQISHFIETPPLRVIGTVGGDCLVFRRELRQFPPRIETTLGGRSNLDIARFYGYFFGFFSNSRQNPISHLFEMGRRLFDGRENALHDAENGIVT